jgi:hypothetical protein
MSSQKKLILVVVLIASLPEVGALGGMAAGWMIGTCAPEYYRQVFRVAPSAQFDAAGVGMGLGFGQGLALGVLLAVVASIVTAWWLKRSRIENRLEIVQKRLDTMYFEVRDLREIVLRLEVKSDSLSSFAETAIRKKVE